MMRLGDYLKEKYKNTSKRSIKRSLEQGACLINGKIERFTSRLIDPDEDEITYFNINAQAKPKLIIDPKRIIYEDRHFVIYNKEPGHPALKTEGKNSIHLHGELRNYLRERLGMETFLEPIHRLDKDTSGLMIFGRDSEAVATLGQMFKEKKIFKEYEAIVDGILKENGRIENFLTLEKKGRGWQKWRVEISGKHCPSKLKENGKRKNAITNYQIVKAYQDSNYTHIRLIPETGRTHQLRVHMSHMGHPILGDVLYAHRFQSKIFWDQNYTNRRPERHLLHASKLMFKHPFNDQDLKLWAPLPDDMNCLL